MHFNFVDTKSLHKYTENKTTQQQIIIVASLTSVLCSYTSCMIFSTVYLYVCATFELYLSF